jgi:hypothetical protein
MITPVIRGHIEWSADQLTTKDLVTCKICIFSGWEKSASCRTRHYSRTCWKRYALPNLL